MDRAALKNDRVLKYEVARRENEIDYIELCVQKLCGQLPEFAEALLPYSSSSPRRSIENRSAFS